MFRNIFKKLYSPKDNASSPIQSTPETHATFRLLYKDQEVGVLVLDNGQWVFHYSDDFRTKARMRPIAEFPDVTKDYRSEDLWPFFAMRIPSLRQSSIDEIITQERIDRNDEAQLLRRFGRRTVSNPFELIAT